MQVLLTFIGFTNFFRCLIFELFFFTNADVVTIHKIRETNGGKIKDQYIYISHWPKILHRYEGQGAAIFTQVTHSFILILTILP